MDDRVRKTILAEITKVRESLLEKLDRLELKTLLEKLNVYLLGVTANSLNGILQRALDAHILASQESVFGNCLERIALAFCGENTKSGTAGVDLDFTSKSGVRLLMALKSGQNWSNANSAAAQSKHLLQAKRIIAQNDPSHIKTGVACCYGRSRTSNGSKLADIKISGQNFWYLISGDKDLYKKLLHEMNQGAAEFEHKLENKRQETYNRLLNELAILCPTGANIWDILIEKCCKNYSDKDKLLQQLMEKE